VGLGGLSIKARALRYLAAREHSRLELERKLARHVEDLPDLPAAAQIGRVLDELCERGLIDERRAAEAVVSARAARFGTARLKQDLRARGIGADDAAEALAGLSDTELARARAVWRRRFGGRAALDETPTATGSEQVSSQDSAQIFALSSALSSAQDRARQARFLAGRGFSGDVIRRVIRGWDETDDPAGSTDSTDPS
jgi:regulatory protein